MSLKIFIVIVTLGALCQGVVPKDSPPPLAEWKKMAEDEAPGLIRMAGRNYRKGLFFGSDAISFQKTGVACESHKLFLKCPNRSEKLVIYNTFYGRLEEGICQHQILPYKGQCTEDEELINKKITELCSDENKCSIAASRDFLLQNGKEKCPHLYKYLTVQYKCVQTPHIYKKCFHKKCVAPAKCWPHCTKDCCEPPPPPKWTSEELALLRQEWSAPGYNGEFPEQSQQYDEKRYNIPGTYLYGMRNSAQSPGFARSRLNYPQVQRNYGYYSANTRSQVPSNTQQNQQVIPDKKSNIQTPAYQNVVSPELQYFDNYAARSKIPYPGRFKQYADWLRSLQQTKSQQ